MMTLEEFKKKQSDKSRLLGLDLGSKRIGVSICDEKQLIATPFKTIIRSSADELINERDSSKIKLTSLIDKSWIPNRCFWEILTALLVLIAIKTNSITIKVYNSKY